MVLEYAREHGSIARREAAELCRITGPQAYRLLKRLRALSLSKRPVEWAPQATPRTEIAEDLLPALSPAKGPEPCPL